MRELAKTHKIPIGIAEEVFHLFIQKIATSISDPDKKEDDLYNIDKFNTIHIDNLGKFKPNIRNIRHANYCLKKNKNED